jgi:galactokinase/mevalonate kinase-like predicted kinase
VGAGGGGFLMLICPAEHQADVTGALGNLGLVRSDFHLDSVGARVLVNNAAA